MNTLAPTVSWELDEADAMQGLTTRQYKFVTLMFQGFNDTEAYRQAGYGGDMNENSLTKAAHLAAHNPKVQAKLRELRERVDEQSTLVPALSREWILNGIMGIAINGDKDSTRLRAYEDLGKVAGIDLFRETTRIEKVTRTPEELDRELAERLGELAQTIEGKATPVESKPAATDRRRKPRA